PSDADDEGELEARRDRSRKPASQPYDRDDEKDDAGEEHGSERRLPGMAERQDDGERDERVLAQVGSDDEGAPRPKPHGERAEEADDRRRGRGRLAIDAGRGKDARVDDENVGGREKGRQAGDNLASRRRPVPPKLKEALEHGGGL